jgi:hypothetical protein
MRRRSFLFSSEMNSSIEAPVACRIFATDSVEGQRGRPSGVIRFERLKLVGSSPAFFASHKKLKEEASELIVYC